MLKDTKRTLKSSQEQAVAAWITHINQLRLNELIDKLNRQDINLEDALKELAEIKQFIAVPKNILGSLKTKHGEIAEHMQVNFSNARRLINGLDKNHTFEGVGRTAPEDYLRNGNQVQSKFYNGLKNTFFGKDALQEHMKKYPNFLKNGGSYDIPKDQYNKMIDILDKYKNNPSQLSTEDYNLAKKIDEFLTSKGLELGKDINSSIVDYSEVQQGVAEETVNNEEKNIRKEDKEQRKKAYEQAKPSLKEGLKVAGFSAAIEGGLAFCMSVVNKRKEKNFSQFTSQDWKDIGIDTGKSALKGGVRGGSIYIMTNFTATPANVASAYVTAAFGIALQAKALEEGKITKEDFVINCETLCLDVTVSTIASLTGQVLIPIPVLGAIIGNVAGEFVYSLCKKYGSEKTQEIVTRYYDEVRELNQQLDIKFQKFLTELNKALKKFKNLKELAFDKDVNIAFTGSIKLAVELGVSADSILISTKNIDDFFIK
ncbi:hypothetical protein HMPREF9629_01437 [Peptoanaerobacter stomatis]|uniref:Uncharacterized protein n=1 Tax=Peptoanaerobacter stomatis TaxID=796937 RepID=G9WZ36_9FIRM|nr:hypothetical protein [Peptoanaerobacter stomatis]EHL16181.1 hypothetical protein HMPREF9629_01437 [Peptoanaerobacter stomatis]